MLTEKDYCDYETCVALKELGYDYPLELITDYFGVLDIPFHDQKIHLYDAQKWLREEKKVEVNALWDRIAEKWYSYIDFMYYPDLMGIEVAQSICNFYEEALSEGIKEAVKILKEK